MAKEETRKRHLSPDVEKKRLLEIDEHYNNMTSNNKLKSQFDYIVYNNYDQESENKILELVKNLINK